MAAFSTSPFLLLKKTKIVLLLAFSQVGGNRVFIIGSSLYSLVIKTHISIPVSSIKSGRRFSNLSFCRSLITSALLFKSKIFCENKT